ncbi:MAG: hypothetical protein LBU00_03645 [Treponema sp.]|jgi:hypothetical protein|nr:hypothetical protein [Treponema sp.]
MYKKFLILILVFIFSTDIYSLIRELGREDDIITGKIILRESYSIHGIQLRNKYFIIFDEPWATKHLGEDIILHEIMISNEGDKFINGINYENKTLKIRGIMGLRMMKNNDDTISGMMAFFIRNIELIE